MGPAIFDTTTLSDLRTRKFPEVVRSGKQYRRSQGAFRFSAITRYEVRRGFHWNGAWDALRAFDEFCERCLVLPITDEVLDQTALLWSEARTNGLPADDADLIIAATALVSDLTLVTSNTRHFDWIDGLTLVYWRQST